ncbi:hypothetical protein QFC24_007009 [Naganishia onofrii]|uniref:Uncharacterized protein n=1 Tax=Naganishia onofrii TaxID=1851511 RepID=A0ACC2WU88_9TREE|nr:hypothetical protein QFC24_007009 [Naganishia onofrii]
MSDRRVASDKNRKGRHCNNPSIEKDPSRSFTSALTLFARQKHPTNSRHRPKLGKLDAGTGDSTARPGQSRSQRKSQRSSTLGWKGQMASTSKLSHRAESSTEAQLIPIHPIHSHVDSLPLQEADGLNTGASPTQTQPVVVDTRNQAAIHRVQHKDYYTERGDRYQLIEDTWTKFHDDEAQIGIGKTRRHSTHESYHNPVELGGSGPLPRNRRDS